MKLVIPMSGKGNRFVEAGYKTLKPLLQVEGRPLISHVLDMFPGEEDVIFICHEDHLATTNVVAILKDLKPNCTIITTGGRQKGPVDAIRHAFDLIGDNEDVMVSYCDFTQNWNYEAFKKELKKQSYAGAVPSYTGFHPHLLRKNVYAGVLVDENNLMLDIKEKHCFTENPEDSYHSSGAYYFASGAILKKYATKLMENDINLNGEYYVSMIYYLLLRDQLPILVPRVTAFRQWGTPVDFEEYEAWSRLIHQDLGLQKSLTEIPPSREPFVTIPYPPSTIEYKKSYKYWQEVLTPKQ